MNQETWEMKVEWCQGQVLLYLSFFWWQILMAHVKWSTAFFINRWCIETSLELTVEVLIAWWYIKLADPGIAINEYVSFEIDVCEGSTVVGHCFVTRVGIKSTVQTLDEFPHIWAIWILHCVLKKIFPIFYLGLIYGFGGFMANINPLLSILIYCPTNVISSTYLWSQVWSHPRFRFLARFCFSGVRYCSWDENIIETRYTKRQVWFIGEIVHVRLDFVRKAGW